MPDWKGIARVRMRQKIAPVIDDLKVSIRVLEERNVLPNGLISAGLTDHLYRHVSHVAEEEVRYTVKPMVQALLVEFGLTGLVSPDDIKRFQWPDH